MKLLRLLLFVVILGLVVAFVQLWKPALPKILPLPATPTEDTATKGPACIYWVAPPPAGNDNNPGTVDQPWASLEYAANNIPDNNCNVWFKAGAYSAGYRLKRQFTTSTTFKSYSPYQAVFRFSGPVVSISGAKNIILDGFVFQHSGPGATPLLVQVEESGATWSEDITLRNNIFRDSYNNDLLKVYNGCRSITIEGNVFYNQGPGEQQMDVNSVMDVVIQDNIFFNDYSGSGRPLNNDTKHYIVIKDSNGNDDGLVGSRNITVQRNIFLNWEGKQNDTFVQVGNDGKSYYEADNVHIVNNLFLGNSINPIGSAFGVNGAKDIWFVNNTIAGDLPAAAYAFRVSTKGSNPQNANIFFYNNIWANPDGTMGSSQTVGKPIFSSGNPENTLDLVLDHNLYWNNNQVVPIGSLISPLIADQNRIVADPFLNMNYQDMVLPRWNGSSFLSGSKTLRDEFERLVSLYARIPTSSPVTGMADPAYAHKDDILQHPRDNKPDLGAYEGY